MKKGSWEKVEQIFHATLELPLKERKTYLRKACAGDDEIFSEVESLIKSLEKDSKFLGETVFELGLGAVYENGRKKLSGSTVGFYKIQEKIGAGGMGEVYKAFDTRLNRHVALKFLSALVEDDQTARHQLVKEAQAAAALDHPNICAVHGIEQADGRHFIVMQYIEGKMLSESIENETINVSDYKNLMRQIVTAVAFAHSHGVIHRDLKPGNIMITPGRQIKVLDFGLAKVVHQKQTPFESIDNKSDFSKNGLIVGTVSYMSPEQLRGEKADYRSDIFSVGIILYELLTKQNPFSRKSQAETIAAILNNEPTSAEKLKPGFPVSFVKLIEKCLQKDPDKRFQSATEILVEIDNDESGSRRRTKFARRGRLFVKFALIAILLFAVFAFGFYFYGGKHSPRSLAVLPISFDDTQSNKEYLADGMTQSIIDKLSNLSDLNIKNESLVSRYKGNKADPRNAGKELNVDAVFVGNILSREGKPVLNIKLLRVSDGRLIDTYDEELVETNLIELTENIASRIIHKIQIRLTQEDNNKLAKKDTESAKAEELYYQGRFNLKRRNDNDALNKAIELFTDAKDLDQKYAKAWAGLAEAYINQSTPGTNGAITPEKAVTSAKLAAYKALDLDNNMCDAYNSLGLINSKYEFNWSDAENNFRTAINLDPEFLPARFGLVGVLILQKRFDEALEESGKIKKIDPLSSSPDIEIAKIYYVKKEYGKMDKILSDVLQRFPDNKRAIYLRSYQFLITGKFKEATYLLEFLYRSDSEADKIFAAAPLGFAYAKTGRRDEAVKIIQNLGKLRKTHYVPAQEKALVYAGLGDYKKVFENLKQSCDEKFYALPSWTIDPIVEEIRSDSRFTETRKCVNLY